MFQNKLIHMATLSLKPGALRGDQLSTKKEVYELSLHISKTGEVKNGSNIRNEKTQFVAARVAEI